MYNWAAVSGSPLLARQNIAQWAGIIFLIVFILGLFFAIAVLIKALHKHSSPEWASKQQDRPTKLKNVNAVAQKYHLSKDEKNMLWEICRTQIAQNIEYLIHDHEKLTELFRNHYLYLLGKNESEETIALLFTLLYRLEQAHAVSREINSSRNIPDGTDLTYIDQSGRKYLLKLLRHDKDAQYVQPSDLFRSLEAKPKELEKITLYFVLPENMHYKMLARIIRYQTAADGTFQMLLTHSNDVFRFNRRQSKRLSVNLKCQFASVDIEIKNKNRIGEIVYSPSEKKYEGMLSDISSGGCSLITSLPLKKDQYIYIEFNIDKLHDDNAIGILCAGQKMQDNGIYLMHIKFIKIALDIQNRIRAYIYNFTA